MEEEEEELSENEMKNMMNKHSKKLESDSDSDEEDEEDEYKGIIEEPLVRNGLLSTLDYLKKVFYFLFNFHQIFISIQLDWRIFQHEKG